MKKLEKSLEERFLKEMIKSCLTYGYGLNNKYITQYYETLGEKRVREICKEEEQYFNEHYEVIANTYTDHEGCTYNSLIAK